MSLERIKNNALIVRECNELTWYKIKDDFEWRDKSNKILNLPFWVFDIRELENYFNSKNISYYMVSLEPKSFGYSVYLPGERIPYDLSHLKSLSTNLQDVGDIYTVIKNKDKDKYEELLLQANKDFKFNIYSMEMMGMLIDNNCEEVIKDSLISYMYKKYMDSDIVLWFNPIKEFQD